MAVSQVRFADPVGYQPAPIHPAEAQRIESLHALQLLDSQADGRFTAITDLAASVFNVQTALVSLVDIDRQWFLARTGMVLHETSRDVAFCAYAIHEDQLLLVEDAQSHPMFQDNPLVTGPPFIRGYAGTVLRDNAGLPLGTLCLLDSKPITLSAQQQQQLIAFGDMARCELLSSQGVGISRAQVAFRQLVDPLTNAYWEPAFSQSVARSLSLRPTAQSLVAFASFENLNYISEVYGRRACDELLFEISNRLRGYFGEIGTVTLGRKSDKHLIVVVDACRVPVNDALVDRICRDAGRLLEQRVKTSVDELAFRAAFTASVHNNCDSLEQSINLCQIATENSIQENSGRFVVLNDAVRSAANAQIRIAADLPSALANHDVELYLQAKVDAHTQETSGAECLIRWHHPTLGFVSPQQILTAARDTNRILELDQWVVRTALSFLKRWNEAGVSFRRLSVNLDGSTICNGSFSLWLQDTLARHDVSGEQLDIEIIESSFFSDFEQVADAMRAISSLGVSFSLDDFGTGYSALSYLRELPVDTIKIDRSFIKNIETDSVTHALCKSILSLADNLRMDTVAEGVETESQFLLLQQMQCPTIQGYFFARPVPVDVFERRLNIA
ncbi:MAG: sensor domain-containing phosphodiesterase [Pseudomonadota bacterium]